MVVSPTDLWTCGTFAYQRESPQVMGPFLSNTIPTLFRVSLSIYETLSLSFKWPNVDFVMLYHEKRCLSKFFHIIGEVHFQAHIKILSPFRIAGCLVSAVCDFSHVCGFLLYWSHLTLVAVGVIYLRRFPFSFNFVLSFVIYVALFFRNGPFDILLILCRPCWNVQPYQHLRWYFAMSLSRL